VWRPEKACRVWRGTECNAATDAVGHTPAGEGSEVKSGGEEAIGHQEGSSDITMAAAAAAQVTATTSVTTRTATTAALVVSASTPLFVRVLSKAEACLFFGDGCDAGWVGCVAAAKVDCVGSWGGVRA
jgi:hypothetical protein